MKHLYRKSDQSREHPIDDGAPHRSAFRRDYARLLHSPAFRRLQGKTQLFPSVESDFFRNRLTHSANLKTVEYRGYKIVREIFGALSGEGGDRLLPDDYRKRVVNAPDELARDRAICDFIAGMTDRYAIEFYGRLRSESAQTIFKPL